MGVFSCRCNGCGHVLFLEMLTQCGKGLLAHQGYSLFTAIIFKGESISSFVHLSRI